MPPFIPLDKEDDSKTQPRDNSEVIIPAVVASVILLIIRNMVRTDFISGQEIPEESFLYQERENKRLSARNLN